MRQGVMLCYPYTQKRLNSWKKPVIIQPKIEGDRCRAIVKFRKGTHEVTLLSSEGNEKVSVPHIKEQLSLLNIDRMIVEVKALPEMELDGELYCHNMKHHIFRRIVSPTVNLHEDYMKVRYHIFDIVNKDKQKERTNKLETLRWAVCDSPNLSIVGSYKVISEEEVLSGMEGFMRSGYEGIILRDTEGLYVRYRSKHIMKLKPRKVASFRIINYIQEQDKHGFAKAALGAFTLSADNGQAFNVGTGKFLTKERREALWQKPDNYVGMKATVLFQDYTERGVPYFPSLLNIGGLDDKS